MKRWLSLKAVSLLLLGAATAAVFITVWPTRTAAVAGDAGAMTTVQPSRGQVVLTISATGRLSALSSVEVGSQVSGQIAEVVADYNTVVRKGDVLARIDASRYQAQLQVLQTQKSAADLRLAGSEVRLRQAERDLLRGRVLLQQQLLSRSNVEQLQQSVSDARTEVEVARVSLSGADAAVRSATYDVDSTVIRSPVDGVVLARRTEPGQTVAASLATPVLFSIAEDLSQMKIELMVDEADIESVRVGALVQFSVDAFAGQVFEGQVQQKRLAARIEGNNATYPVIVVVDNQARQISSVRKAFAGPGTSGEVLRGVDLRIAEGEYVSIMGPSGSGKSTLLAILGGLDAADSGQYRCFGVDLSSLSEAQRARLRNSSIGFVFQRYHLLPTMTASQNVALPLDYAGLDRRRAREQALLALQQVGLHDRAGAYPRELSGGQQQRVAIARALVTRPRLLLADEPTGSLDSRSAQGIVELLESFAGAHTLVMVTHDARLAARAERQLHLSDGQFLS